MSLTPTSFFLTYFDFCDHSRLTVNGDRLTARYHKDTKDRYRKGHYCDICINFCILALGSGQRLLYRLGSGLRLVLVLRCNAIAHTVLHVSRGPLR